jgi:putative SOS response-associated peptidase YedK
MCGRFLLTAPPEAVTAELGYRDGEWFPPRYNIAPGQPIAVARFVRGERRFGLVRWGLVPSWAKDPRRPFINARADGLPDRPAFRGAVQYRRCLVPATGYYHWERRAGASRPWLIRRRDGGLIAFAGLWDPWLGADGSEIDGAAIVTVMAGADLAGIADRMPAVIAPADYDSWLDSHRNSADAALDALRPMPAGSLEAVPVDARVNKAANDDALLVPPLSSVEA